MKQNNNGGLWLLIIIIIAAVVIGLVAFGVFKKKDTDTSGTGSDGTAAIAVSTANTQLPGEDFLAYVKRMNATGWKIF